MRKQSIDNDGIDNLLRQFTHNPDKLKKMAKLAGQQADAMKEVIRCEKELQEHAGIDSSHNLTLGSVTNLAVRIIKENE